MFEIRVYKDWRKVVSQRVCLGWITMLFLGTVLMAGKAGAAHNWPSFRGLQASGVSEGSSLPVLWNVADKTNVMWQTPIPGLAHSSPVVWGDRVFVSSAASSRSDASFRHGLYGDGDASEDRSFHLWKLYCLEKQTGKIIWERVSRSGEPACKRHVKSTYANATPATNGRYVVVSFGCEGLYAYNLDGDLAWSKDLGVQNVGAYDAPAYEWGPASSPIIFRDRVVVQIDTQEDSFVMAIDIQSGETVWKTMRDELPSWGTPTVYEGPETTELITNGSNFIRGYNPETGAELWRLGGSSKITAPTPIVWDDLIIVASGRRPEQPIFAIRTGAKGNITLSAGEESNESVRWAKTGRGPYMPTPLAYDGRLYVISNQGILDCYDVRTGQSIYRNRILHRGGGFSASPVAGDGKIYLASEDGDIFVVKADDRFELLATNGMGELLMATPAISEGAIYVRGQHHLFAIRDKADSGSE